MKPNEMGVCPKCGVDGCLEYDVMDLSDDGNSAFYPYYCMACKFSGAEYYLLQFDTHVDEEGREPNHAMFDVKE